MKSLYPCLFLALSAVMLPGCRAKTSFQGAGAADPMPAPVVPTAPVVADPVPAPVSPFEVTASATKTAIKAGEPLEFSVEIRNTLDKSADLNFSSSQKFDVSATRVGETDEIWSYGMNKRFAQMLSTMTLEAGKSLQYKTVWRDAPAGTYTISALIKANGGLKAIPFQVVVK